MDEAVTDERLRSDASGAGGLWTSRSLLKQVRVGPSRVVCMRVCLHERVVVWSCVKRKM